MIEILGAAAADLEEVIVVTGNVMALDDLVHFGDGAEKRGAVAVAGERDGDIGGERVADRCRVYESGVAADDAALVELAAAIGGGRGGGAAGPPEARPAGRAGGTQQDQS